MTVVRAAIAMTAAQCGGFRRHFTFIAMLVPIAVMMDNKERRREALFFFVLFNVPPINTRATTITKDNDVLVLS